MKMTTIEVPDGIDPVDFEGLKLSMEQCRVSSKMQADQLDSMLMDRKWFDVACFAAYDCQIRTLRLKPWETAPMDVIDPNEPRYGEEAAARLLKRMLQAGVSRYAPDPMGTLEASEKGEKAT
jgi:hypothetical protein